MIPRKKQEYEVCRSEMSFRTFGHKMSDSPTVGWTYPTYAVLQMG